MSTSAQQRRTHDAVGITASPTTWTLSCALAGIVAAEALVAYGSTLSGSIACAVVLDALAVGCVATARGRSSGRSLPPLSAALLALSLVPLARLASLSLPAHELARSAWPAAVGLIVLVGAWQIAPLSGQLPLRTRLRRPVPGDARLAAAAVLVGALWFGLVSPSDVRLPSGSGAIATTVVLLGAAAVAEEVVFRGVLLDALTRARTSGARSRARVESTGADVMASVAYGAACLGWPMPTPLVGFVMALVLGRIAQRRQSVTGVAIAHWVAWIVAAILAPALFGSSDAGFLLR